MYVCMYVCMSVCMYVFMYVYICACILLLRASKIHNLYEYETDKHVALTQNYWPSLINHSYLQVTAHYFDIQWELWSYALTKDRGQCGLLFLVWFEGQVML